MPLVTWDEKYSVGIQEIDKQHKKLIDLSNQLHDAMISGKGKQALTEVLAGLVDYTNVHFKYEEKLLETNGYPELANHQQQHRALVEQVASLKKRFDSGELAVSVEVKNFLKSWLLNHISSTDKRYQKYLTDKGVK